MQEDIKKVLDFFKNNYKKYDYLPLTDNGIDINIALKDKLNERLYRDYFYFLEKYRTNLPFFEKLIKELGIPFTYLKLFLPEDYFNSIKDYFYQNGPEYFVNNYDLISSNDIDYLISLGYTLNEIVSKTWIINPEVIKEIYLRDNSLANDLILKKHQEAYIVAALEYIKGNKDILKYYLDNVYGTSSLTDLLKYIVDNCNSFDLDYLLKILMEKIAKDELSSSYSHNDISFIEDNNLIAELIKKGNSRALVFAKNPISELIQLARDFSFEDYKFINGNYKKSEDLLLLFLEDKKLNMVDVLAEAPLEAFGDKIYNFLVENKIAETNPQILQPLLKKRNHSLIIELIKTNPEIIKFCNINNFNSDEIFAIIDIYPQVIDSLSFLSNEMIKKAFYKGYKITEKVPTKILKYAIQNGFKASSDIILNRSYKDIFDIILNDYIYSENQKEFAINLLDNLYNRDKDEFVWQLACYTRKSDYYEGTMNILLELNDKYKTQYRKLYPLTDSTKERYLLNILLLEISQLPDEEFYKKVEQLLEKSPLKYDIINKILARGNVSLANKYIKQYFADEPYELIKLVHEIDEELASKIRNVIFNHPQFLNYDIVYTKASHILTTKEDILKFLEISSPYYINTADNKEEKNFDIRSICSHNFFNYLDEKFKKDFDILSVFLNINPRYIIKINPNIERYKELCYQVSKSLKNYPYLYKDIKNEEIKKDGELLKTLLPICPNAFIYADSSLQTLEYFNLISNYEELSFKDMNIPTFEKIISYNKLNASDNNIRDSIMSYIINHADELSDEVFTNKFIIDVFYKSIEDYFKQVILLSKRFNLDLLDPEISELLKNANEIIRQAGQINLLDNNSLLTYDLVKYIYPVLKKIHEEYVVLDLLKYNSKAAAKLTQFIKAGAEKYIIQYWNFVKEFNLFPKNDRLIHMAFMDYDKFFSLMANIIPNKNSLNEQDIANLRNIIINYNVYNINSFDELKNYNKIVDEHVIELLNGNDILKLKNNLATLFGFESIQEMETTFVNFQLDNFAKLAYIYTDIKNKYGLDKLKEVVLDKEDIKLITLMKKIIESDNILEIKDLFNNIMNKNSKSLDYNDETDNLIDKVRRIYNLQFNAHLTQIDDIKSSRLMKDDPNNKYGVTIIKMDSEPFQFLAHRIFNYDPHMVSGGKTFLELLTKDPSLWTKLDGASTISTSSISDKGFWFLNNTDDSGVIYLFNNLPPDFLLFMEGSDICIEHGGHCLNPRSHGNSFTDIESLNQDSCYFLCEYNEVAGFRKGMIPCAFACIGKEPNKETIEAAKYFSNLTEKDIPIIMFNVKAYDKIKEQKYEAAKSEYSRTSSLDSLKDFFFDGRKIEIHTVISDVQAMRKKVNFCLDVLKRRYYNKEITIYDMIRKIQELENVANRIFSVLPFCNYELKKLQLYKKTLLSLQKTSQAEIIKLEMADMGETGIMYKFEDEGKTYLVKPAVDKQKLQEQPFRAELQKAASKLQKIISPETAVDIESIRNKVIYLSKQELLNIDKEETNKLINWVKTGGPIEQKYLDQLLREYVLDYVLGNFDAYSGNFIIDLNGNVRGIDKEQSFRFIDYKESLPADFSYTPNGEARIPIYKTMFDRYKNKEINLNLNIVFDTLNELKKISDEEYKEIFKDYAETLDQDHAQELLEKILNRKHIAPLKIEEFISSLGYNKEMGGVKL